MKWAWVAGASEGLGFAFAQALAARGYGLVLLARREQLLTQAAHSLTQTFAIPVEVRAVDLADAGMAAMIETLLPTHPPALAVYNAAFAPAGPFIEQSVQHLQRVVAVNVSGPLLWSRLLGADMAARGGGALILMSSLAGEQGSPGISAYAASKAFNTRLAEGLWAELQARGVQVLVCCAGAIATPGYAQATSGPVTGQLSPEQIAEQTLTALGKRPRVIPGWQNKLGAWLLGRALPRGRAIRIMQRITRSVGVDP